MRAWASLLAAMLGACNPAPDREGDTTVGAEISRSATSLADIQGHWRVVSIDDEVLPESEKEPYIAISEDAVDGSIGCNAFGGLALFAEGRVAVHSWGGTAMGCPGRLNQHEQAISELFRANPQVVIDKDRLELRSSEHRLRLMRAMRSSNRRRSPDPMRIPVAGPVSQTLDNTRWRILTIDRRENGSDPKFRYIGFEDGSWQGMAACATLFGNWRKDGDRLIVDDKLGSTEQNCREDHAKIDEAFAALMRSDPRYLIGPNGELLMAGGGHTLAGMRDE